VATDASNATRYVTTGIPETVMAVRIVARSNPRSVETDAYKLEKNVTTAATSNAMAARQSVMKNAVATLCSTVENSATTETSVMEMVVLPLAQ